MTSQVQPAAAGKCAWRRGTVEGLTDVDRAALAWMVATAVMEHRCGASSAYDLWRTSAIEGASLRGRDRDIVAAFVAGVFGLPPDGKSEDHLIGHVAEWIWYLHAMETVDPVRSIAILEPPKFNVTEPGADGFVVYLDTGNGSPHFRLWEIKQHVGGAALSRTVGAAYRQISSEATRYLAQLTSIHAETPGVVGELCSRLVDAWVDAAPSAGAGVSVASKTVPAPTRCFSTMGNYFPRLNNAHQLEGLIVAVDDLAGFGRYVREYLWTAL